ncbi:phosphoenolpyruvate hydrolase family protein [Streptomyces sp. NBC_00090]|uniref:phosphoenolpyruvate hydrolase family protein n=1 Tax=Streptomyces sp. NBC_00090 TaxID=2903619 RepID=UPI00324CDBD9
MTTGSTISRQDVLARLRARVAAGRPIVGAGAGTGLSAKCAEAGGVDLLIIWSTPPESSASSGPRRSNACPRSGP